MMDVADPVCGPDEILLRVRAASLCGTDTHIYQWDPSIRPRIEGATEGVSRPLTIGHEFCGEVVEVGTEVRGVAREASERIQIGDFVSAESHIVCWKCYSCRRGQHHVCARDVILGVERDGGFAEYVSIPATCAWVNREPIPAEVASVLEPFGNAVHAATEYSLEGASVVIFGAGPIGLFTVVVALAEGARDVVVVDPMALRLELAKQVGATCVIETRALPVEDEAGREAERSRVVEAIHESCADGLVDLCFEMSGHPDAIDNSLRVLRRGGKMIAFGLSRGNEIPFRRYSHDVVFGGITIKGIIGRKIYDTWYKTRELTARPEVRRKIQTVVTDVLPFQSWKAGLDKMVRRESGKVVLRLE
jgi:threonine 3-dehydrogenase